MKNERKYVISENRLIELLVAEMTCVMNERDGVDNWGWYGSSYEDVVKEYWPGEDEDGDTPDMYECAKARLEAGEFQEQVDVQELLGNIFVDMDILDEQNSYD